MTRRKPPHLRKAPQRPGPSLVQRLDDYWTRHPDAALSTRDALQLFGGTAHSFRQAIYLLRRTGTPVRCDRMFRLRQG